MNQKDRQNISLGVGFMSFLFFPSDCGVFEVVDALCWILVPAAFDSRRLLRYGRCAVVVAAAVPPVYSEDKGPIICLDSWYP